MCFRYNFETLEYECRFCGSNKITKYCNCGECDMCRYSCNMKCNDCGEESCGGCV